jgi:hypothetical protein
MNQLESIFWGILSGLSAIFLEFVVFASFTLITNPTNQMSMASFFTVPGFVIAGAFIEELCKYKVISTRIEMLSLKHSYMLNSLLVGLGFFAVELGLILSSGNIPASALILELAIIHMGTSALMGYIIAFRSPAKISTLLLAVFPALVFHASYNILSLSRNLITDYAINCLLAVLVLLTLGGMLDTYRKLAQE